MSLTLRNEITRDRFVLDRSKLTLNIFQNNIYMKKKKKKKKKKKNESKNNTVLALAPRLCRGSALFCFVSLLVTAKLLSF